MSENLDDLVIIDEDKKQENLIEKMKSWPMAYYIVAVNVFVFAIVHLTNILIADNWFVINFSKYGQAIALNNEYYRLFTAIFTHEAPMHLFFNCYAITILGHPIEQIFGKRKFLIIFLVSGLFGSLTSFIFSAGYSIGASGGVFGIFGVHLYLFIKNKTTYLKVFGKDMLQLLVINVIVGFVLPNIDYYGHFGGIIGGFLSAVTLGLSHKISINKTFIGGVFLSCLLFIGSLSIFSNNLIQYYNDVDPLIVEFNQAIPKNSVEELIRIKHKIEDVTPLLPPTIHNENIMYQIDDIINEQNKKDG